MADVSISYKGNEIASLSDTGSVTLATAGTYVDEDITIDYTKSGGGGASSVDVTITDPDGLILQIYKPTTATESLVYPTFSLTAPANSMLTMFCGLNPTINSITNATYDIATPGPRPMQYIMMLYLTDQDATLSISMM